MAEATREIPLYFLLPPRLLLLDVAGPAEVFFFANRYQQQVHFSLHFIAPEVSVLSAVGLPLAASPLPASLPQDAILLLPGMSGEEPEWQLPANQALLAGHRCTTHHSHCQQLGLMAPGLRRIVSMWPMAGSGAAPG